MSYSTAGHHLSQVNTADTEGVLALFTDAVRAHVAAAGGEPTDVHTHIGTYVPTRTATGRETDALPALWRDSGLVDTPAESLHYLHNSNLRCDPELARIAVALRLSALLRLWIILRQIARDTGAMAFNRDTLRSALQSIGVPYTESSLSRWIHAGDKVFWNIDDGANLIYPASPVLVASRLIDRCKARELYNLYITNYPGQRRDMFITVNGGDTRAFERRVYEAWMASRNNPSISLWTLEQLWNRSAVTLRAMTKGSRIQVVSNYAFCDIDNAEYTPFDSEGKRRKDVQRVKIDGRYCWRWQISNTYHAPITRQHHKRGVGRRVHYTVKKKYPEIQATSASDAEAESLGSLNRTHRMFFNSREKARSNADQYGEAIRYVLLGHDDGNVGLYEVSPDGKERFRFGGAAATMRRRGVHSSAMCAKIMERPF